MNESQRRSEEAQTDVCHWLYPRKNNSMRFVLIAWPVISFLILVLLALQAEYGTRGPKGEYLIDLSTPHWLVLSGLLGLLAAGGLKLLLVLFTSNGSTTSPNHTAITRND